MTTIGVGSGWAVSRVAELIVLENGYPFDSENFQPAGDMPLVRIRDLMGNIFETYVDGPVPSRVILEDGDVVIGMDGDFNVIRWSRGPAALNQRLCRLRSRGSHDVRFVEYAIPDHLKSINEAQFATTVKHLSSAEVMSIRLKVPVPGEQRRIADFLDEQVAVIDEALSARRAARRLLHEQAKARLVDRVLGSSTARVRVRSLIASEALGAWGVEPSGLYDVRVARVADFDRKTYMLTGAPTIRSLPPRQARPRLLREGDVLLERSGGTTDRPVGAAVSYSLDQGPTITSNFVARLRPADGTDGRYLTLVLSAMYEARWNGAYYTQTTGIQNLDSAAYLRLSVPKREVVEQRQIAFEIDARLETSLGADRHMNEQASLLEERKRALITAAVTGELDVTTASTRAATAVTG